jgi:NAD(P)-dependent dehydrogenase (short-subunit alcohol dehydrogenase family)
MDYGLDGRTIVVTGTARGQGAAEAEILVREGARVIGADILDADGMALAARLTEADPGRMEYYNWTCPASRSGRGWRRTWPAGRCTA